MLNVMIGFSGNRTCVHVMSLARWDAEADSAANELNLKRYEDDSDTSSMSSGCSSDSEGCQQLGSTLSWVVQRSRPAHWVVQLFDV